MICFWWFVFKIVVYELVQHFNNSIKIFILLFGND